MVQLISLISTVEEAANMDTQYQLEAHERECAVRYEYVQDKLDSLEKRMWRLEGLIMVSTLATIGAAVTVITLVL